MCAHVRLCVSISACSCVCVGCVGSDAAVAMVVALCVRMCELGDLVVCVV